MCNRLCWYFSFVHSGKQGSRWKWSRSCTEAINEFSPHAQSENILQTENEHLDRSGTVCASISVCDCLSSDPQISPANLKDGKSTRTLPIDHFFLAFSILGQAFSSHLSHVQLSQYPSLIIFSPPTMSCSCLSFLTSVFSQHLAAIFFSVMTCFSSSAAFLSHPPRFLFKEKPDSSPPGWWVKMSLFLDIWVITMKYAEPMNTHARRAVVNLIWFLVTSNSSEFFFDVLRSDVWRYHSGWVKAYVGPSFTNIFIAHTDPSPVISDPSRNFLEYHTFDGAV